MAAERKQRVAHLLSGKTQPILSPQQPVVAVAGGLLPGKRGLLPGRAGQDEPVQSLERTFRFIAKPDREPVEQLRMARHAAHFPEIIRRVTEAASEVVMPHTVHDAAPGEHIPFVGEPERERGTAGGFVGGIGDGQRARHSGNAAEGAGADEFTGPAQFTAREQADRARLRRGLEVLAIRREIPGHGIDKLWRGQCGERALIFQF